MAKQSAPHPESPNKPNRPTDITKPNWIYVMKSAAREFGEDGMTDAAAGLTYFTVLSLFPAIIALVSILSLLGQSGDLITNLINDLVAQGALPRDMVDTLMPVIQGLLSTPAPGLGLIIGILVALWSASNYVKAFSRAMNTIYEVPEGRGLVKFNLWMYGLTALLLVLMALVLMGFGISGPLAESIGNVIGMGDTAVTVLQWVKWPILVVLIAAIIALLYWGTPNVKHPKFRWISPGAIVAIVVAAIASALFAFYVANFGSYNATYGALAGVIIFLFWLNIINSVLLFGGEVDAELERGRQLQAGIEAEDEIQLPLRDDKAAIKKQEKHDEAVRQGRALRLTHGRTSDPDEVPASALVRDEDEKKEREPKDHYPND